MRPKSSLLSAGLGKTLSAKGKIPALGIESVEEGQEQLLPKHASAGGSVRNRDNLMFGQRKLEMGKTPVGGGLTPRGPPNALAKTSSAVPAKVPQLKGLAIEERASEELVEHADVELEFDSALPKSARQKGMHRAGTLEESGTNDLSTISPVLRTEGESRLNHNESVISSLNMGDESVNQNTKASFLSGDGDEGPGQTPDFAAERPEPGRTMSRLGTEEPEDLNKGILVHSLQTLFEEIARREKIENRIFIIKCAYFEIYNDQVFDLLNESFIQSPEPLMVLEDKVSRFNRQ